MENFLSEPDYNEIRNNIIGLTQKEDVLICSNSFNLDSLIISSLVMKYSNGVSFLSFENTEGCDLLLKNEPAGRWLEMGSRKYYLGNTSFSSVFSLSMDDVLPILTGVLGSALQERRQLTDIEKSLIQNSDTLGVTIETNLKIPAYKQLPLFVSVMLSIDPYIPDMTGSRENSVKLVRDLGVNETTKLEELNDAQLNSLIYRIVASVSKYRQYTGNELKVTRIFFMEYDLLEVVFASLYHMDIYGSKSIFEMVFNPSFAEVMIDEFRSQAMKGFSFNVREEKNVYVVDTQLMSPQLAHLVAIQMKSKSKPVLIARGNKYFSSRFFFPKRSEEGLVQVDDVN